MHSLQKEIYSELFKVHGKALLTSEETACILGMSRATLDRLRNEGLGLNYKKLPSKSKSNNSRVLYPLDEIARYIVDNRIQTA